MSKYYAKLSKAPIKATHRSLITDRPVKGRFQALSQAPRSRQRQPSQSLLARNVTDVVPKTRLNLRRTDPDVEFYFVFRVVGDEKKIRREREIVSREKTGSTKG